MKETHDKNSKLKVIAWGGFNALPLPGTIDVIACTQIAMEEEDVGIKRDRRGWWFVLPETSLLQQVHDGVNVS